MYMTVLPAFMPVHPMFMLCVLGTESQSSVRTVSALVAEPSLLPLAY